MVTVAILRTEDADYTLEQDFGRWFFTWSKGRSFERFPLDYDRRHQRLFLSEKNERRVGVKGIVALERLTRKVLDR